MRGLRAWAAGAAVALAAALPAVASPTAEDMARTLKLPEVAAILRDEGLDYAGTIETDLLGGAGGALWQARVAALYDPARIEAGLRDAIAATMSPGEIEAAIAFFGTDRGQAILDHENAARRAMSDPAVEEAARAHVEELSAADDAHLARVQEFVEANDLLERNVAGALSSNYQFLRGFADGGGASMSDSDIVSDVWGQEAEVREDTGSWLLAFLVMAYAPLPPDDLQAYTAFSQSQAGRALNAALFTGFETLYRDISYALGLMAGQGMQGSDL